MGIGILLPAIKFYFYTKFKFWKRHFQIQNGFSDEADSDVNEYFFWILFSKSGGWPDSDDQYFLVINACVKMYKRD